MSFVASQTLAFSFASASSQTISLPAIVEGSQSGLSINLSNSHFRLDSYLNSNGIASVSFDTSAVNETVSIPSAGMPILGVIKQGASFMTVTAAQPGTVLIHLGYDNG